tara:strand:+ start:1001 stop:1597 length:597 start_codon:yes stop_codon:yes gene_type:complete
MSQDAPNGTATPSRLTIGIVVVTSALATLATLALVYAFSNMSIRISEFPMSSCYEMQKSTVCFFKDDMRSDGMISVLSTFYTNLIVIMVSILTLIGVLAAFSIRYSAKQHVEAELPELTSAYFTTGEGKSLMAAGLLQVTEDISAKFQALEEINLINNEFISGFSDRLNQLQYEVDSMDTGQIVTSNNGVEEEDEDGE